MPTHLALFTAPDATATLLLEADPAGLRELHSICEALASGRMKRAVIHLLPFVTTHGRVELRAIRSDHAGNLRRDAGANPASVTWERPKESWRDAAAKLAALLAADEPAHQRLDAPGDEVLFLVSAGEYGEEWWADHA